MNFTELLWPGSYKKWNFFYDLHESNYFNKKAYKETLRNVSLYKNNIFSDTKLNKKIIWHIYLHMWLIIWTIKDIDMWKYEISWLKNQEQLYDYYEELDWEVMLLFSIV